MKCVFAVSFEMSQHGRQGATWSIIAEQQCAVQLRYMLGGDRDRSMFAGMGKNPPTHVQNRAASCPDAPTPCNLVSMAPCLPRVPPL